MDIDPAIARMPKVELHVHLEGSMRAGTLAELADVHRVALPSSLAAGRWEFTDFLDFLDQYIVACSILNRDEDFHRVAVEFIDDLEVSNVRYAEVTFTPGGHAARLEDWNGPIEAVLAGFEERGRELGITTRVILDHSRDRPMEDAIRTARLAVEYVDRGVVALGLGGDERYGPELFEEPFRIARDGGVAAIVHAGEFTGPESVWGALDILGSSRIGHGIAAAQDPVLLQRLADEEIVLEICPTSNLATGVVADLDSHPFPQLTAAGVKLTLNSDDPAMFNTSLNREFQIAHDRWGVAIPTLEAMTVRAAEAACDPEAASAALAE